MTTIKRFVVALLLSVVAWCSTFGVATAVYPPGGGLTVSTNQQVYLPGVPIVVTAHGCGPGIAVTFTITPNDGSPITLTATTDESGNASVVANGIVDGHSAVTASCGTDVASSSFLVQKFLAVPKTGTDVQSLVAVGVVLVAVGLGLLLVARSRRRDRSLNIAA